MTPRCLGAAGLLMLATLSLAGTPTGADTPALRIAAPPAQSGQAGAPAGDLAGFEADLAAAICQRVRAKCELVAAAGGDPLTPLLQSQADAVIAGLSVSPEIHRKIDFSRPYASVSHGFAIMRPGRLSDLPGPGETLSLSLGPGDATAMIAALRTAFAGKTIAAASGTPDRAFLAAHFGDVATIPDYATTAAFESDLVAGRIDAIMAPVIGLHALAAQPAYRQLVQAGPRFFEDAILGFGLAVGMRKSDRAPHDMVDRAIDDMIGDGSLRRLSLKWFDMDITPHRCACKPF